MALLEGALKGWGGGLAIGVGAALVAPVVLPAAGAVVRPIAKGLIWGALLATDKMKELVAETREQMNDLVAEVRAEYGDGVSVPPSVSEVRKGRSLNT
jgi:hypothetical protein